MKINEVIKEIGLRLDTWFNPLPMKVCKICGYDNYGKPNIRKCYNCNTMFKRLK